MSRTSEISIRCSRCGSLFKAERYDSVNVSLDPSLKDKVLDGSLFLKECPHCGSEALIPGNTLYHDQNEKLMVWVTGGDSALEEQVKKGYEDLLKGYVLRFVTDSGSLIEKVKILDSGLDDVVMEMCKYVTAMEIAGKMKDREADIMAAPFKFLRMDGADGEITLAYPLDGEMQMVGIGFNVYEDCRGIVKRNPSLKEASSGFCRIDRDWLNRFVL